MIRGRVCLLTSVHGARDIRIYEKEAKALAAAGYEVILVNRYESGREGSITLRRAPVPAGRVGRILLSWLIYFRQGLCSGAKVCHFHDPELIPAGLLLRLCGRRVIYDVHEDLPRQLLYKPYLTGDLRQFFSKLAEWVEKLTSRWFDVNLCATEQIARRFPNARVLHNYPLKREAEQFQSKILPYCRRRNQMCYIGAISENRGIFTILEAVEESTLTVKLAGRYEDENLKMRCQIHGGFKNAEYLGVLGREEIFRLLGESKAGLLLLEPTKNYLESLPIKLFEYLMAGVPVICSDFPLWRRLLGGCAIFVNPADPQAVRREMESLLQNPQRGEELARKGRSLIADRYTFEREEPLLLDIYRELMK